MQAFLAAPEDAATTARSTFLFVGQRFVRDRALLAALAMGYGPLLERGRYPLAALFVDVAAADVDVNVHPQKLEVRFSQPQLIYAAVRHVVAAAIARAPWLAPSDAAAGQTFSRLPWQQNERSDADSGTETDSGARPGALRLAPVAVAASGGPRQVQLQAAPPVEGDPLALARFAEAPAFYTGLRYLGSLQRTYLVCEQGSDLVLLDQHAAHERVVYERLRKSHAARAMRGQRLLFPVPIDLDDALAALAVSANAPEGLLHALGFEVQVQGNKLFVHAVPELAAGADPKPMVLDVLSHLSHLAHDDQDDGALHGTLALERIDRVLSTLACHSVVRAGDVLSIEQVEGLLRQLDAVDLRSHCPHGRPVVVRIGTDEIMRRFGRT